MVNPGDLVRPVDESIIAFGVMLRNEKGEMNGFDEAQGYLDDSIGLCVAAVDTGGETFHEMGWTDTSGWTLAFYTVWPHCVGWSYKNFIRKVDEP